MGADALRILIVDDDEDMRATLLEFIGRMSVAVRQAATVSEAQKLLRSEADPFDLVLTDLRLPDGSGLEIVRAAHVRKPDTLVSIITGFASLDTAIEAVRLGAYDYITKPFTLDQIGIQVRNMIQRVLLSKENARLSLRLQELYQEVNRLQAERLDAAHFHDEIRRQLLEANHKLDQIITLTLPESHPADQSERLARTPVAKYLLELGNPDDIGR